MEPKLYRLKETASKAAVEKAVGLIIKPEDGYYVVAGPLGQAAQTWLEKRDDGWYGHCTCSDFVRNVSRAGAQGVAPCSHIIAVKQYLKEQEPKQEEAQEASELVVVPQEPPQPVQGLSEFLERQKALGAFIKKALVPGVDYAPIPGTTRPVLLKPGAEKLAMFFGLEKHFELVKEIEDWDTPFFYYRYRCQLFYRGRLVSEAYGSANSREAKWGYRWVTKEELLPGQDPEALQKKVVNGVTKYRVENPDIYSLIDTIQKMALKRAFVAAVRLATATSGIFAEELEEE